MKVIAITQARMGSTRFHGKIMRKIGDQSLLELHVRRTLRSKMISKLIIATTTNSEDDCIAEFASTLGIKCHRGSTDDVLDRFHGSLLGEAAEYVVRLTSDCPLIDPELIDKVIDFAIANTLDYASNVLAPSYPDGQDVEVFTCHAIEQAWAEATLPSDREHVTPYIWRNSTFHGGSPFRSRNFHENESFGHLRMTVDEPVDYELIQNLVLKLGPNRTWKEYATYIQDNSNIRGINERIGRNEGYIKSLKKEENMSSRYQKSEEYLRRALKAVPLGSQTFSKSKTQLPVGVSPFFASKGEGAYLWDVDGNRYIDFVNSLASITLGYNDPDVNRAVVEQFRSGTIFSLAHELEFKVAEKIIEMVPCAEMVRFGKNGSDATSGAIRLARAYTRRDHVLVCGYHGWQDWYIGSTTRDLGVPKAVKDLTHKFNYNDIESLKRKLDELRGNVAAVILEPVNIVPPEDNFLEKVKELTHACGAVLVFDETITGFRYANGGAQQFFGVTPDLACFGKGLANGYPVSAVAGKTEIMKLMEDIFFSFTFGGETLSLAASLAVLTKLQQEPVVERLFQTGEYLIQNLNQLISEFDLKDVFGISGYPVWSFLTIKDTQLYNSWELKTLLLQEMFANGIFILGTHNISYAHTQDDIQKLMLAYQGYFEKVKSVIQNKNLQNMLKCEPLKPLFKVR
jgi:glutamate-1-semialdehyde 2,1-aminomutase